MPRIRDALATLRDAPFFDLHESEDGYRFVVDVPGVPADRLEFRASDGRIVIEGKRADPIPDDAEYVEANRLREVEGRLPVPSDADPSKTESLTRRGVLELTMPKRGASETTIDVVDASGSVAERDTRYDDSELGE